MRSRYDCLGSGIEVGFSLVEMMITTLLALTLAAIAVPAGRVALQSYELGNAQQELSLALQTARLRAVAVNRPMRLRLNCQFDGQYRVVEVTGVASVDNAVDRCDETTFVYPGPKDSNPATPTHDGPLRRLCAEIDVLDGPDLEFAPDGTTRVVEGGVAQLMSQDAVVELTRDGVTARMTINALGRIHQEK